MARYIDADALGIGRADRNAFEIPEYADGWNSAIEIIANAPTADVAPKSEVASMPHKCKDCAGCTQWKCDCSLIEDNAKTEVAREIFEEIEEIFNKRIAFYTDMAKQSKFTEKHYAETMIKNCEIYLQEIAELKKKYPGEQT